MTYKIPNPYRAPSPQKRAQSINLPPMQTSFITALSTYTGISKTDDFVKTVNFEL